MRLLRAILTLAILCAGAISAPVAQAQQAGIRRQDNLVYFNLQNVDIRSALESISEVLGISYVLGGNVQPGLPITVSTAQGIPIEKVPDLLDSVLRTYNLTLIRTGDIFTVMQAQDVTEGVIPGAQPTRTQVYVYYLRNANAVDLANVLTQLFQGGAPAGGFTRREPGARSLSRALEGQQLDIQPPVEEGEEGGMTPFDPRRPTRPPNMQPQLQQQSAVITGELIGQTSIVPDENTNSLIIRTAPENYPSIEETIRKLDVRPLQVLIEVTIAEILLDKSTQFGIDFIFRPRDVFENDTDAEIERRDPNPPQGGLRARVFNRADVDATLRALAADSRVNVLSTPRILSINNQEARILVGSEVPFVQFQRSTIGEAVDRVVQFRNVGLELTVTPRINPDRYISMDLLQQVSSLSADVLFDAPIITTREAETSLVVSDRQTVVLGGLIEDRKEKRRSGIPFLKDIPILGALFGSQSTRTIKTELIITLTPYIVGSDLELQNLRQELESGTEFYQEELQKRREEGRPVPGGTLGPSRPGAERDTSSVPRPDTLPPSPPDTLSPATPDTVSTARPDTLSAAGRDTLPTTRPDTLSTTEPQTMSAARADTRSVGSPPISPARATDSLPTRAELQRAPAKRLERASPRYPLLGR